MKVYYAQIYLYAKHDLTASLKKDDIAFLPYMYLLPVCI